MKHTTKKLATGVAAAILISDVAFASSSLLECQFDAPATMTRNVGTVSVGDVVNISVSFDVSTATTRTNNLNLAAYETTNGSATVTHPTDGELTGTVNDVQITDTGGSSNPLDTLNVWLDAGWEGNLGGITVPTPNLVTNGFATGFPALRFTDNTGPVIDGLEFPSDLGIWNGFQAAGTAPRSLRLTIVSNSGILQNNVHGANIGQFVGGCVPIVQTPRSYVAVGQLKDFNYSGSPKIAALSVNGTGQPQVRIKEAVANTFVKNINFLSPDFVVIDMSVVEDMNGNGVEEIVVIGINVINGNVRAQIKDVSTKESINNLFFAKY